MASEFNSDEKRSVAALPNEESTADYTQLYILSIRTCLPFRAIMQCYCEV